MSCHVKSCMYECRHACTCVCLSDATPACTMKILVAGQNRWINFVNEMHTVSFGCYLLWTLELCFSHSLNVCSGVRFKGQMAKADENMTNHVMFHLCFHFFFVAVLTNWITIYLLLCGLVCVCIDLYCVALSCIAFLCVACSVWNHQLWTGSQDLVMQQCCCKQFHPLPQ